MTWEVGTITVPSGTGSQAITGLAATPAAVLFFGTNFLTEDASVTSRGCGIFRGMCAPDYSNPSVLVQNAACVLPAGDAHSQENVAIDMLDTSGTLSWLYVADVTSFDAHGFTLNWSVASAGGYKVVYAALMDITNVGSSLFTGSVAMSLGFKAGASLLHGAWAGPGGNAGADRTQEFYGGAAYPGTGGGASWFSAGLTAFTFPTSFAGQFNIGIDTLSPGTQICNSGNFSGPFLATQNVTAIPTGGGLTTLTLGTGTSDNGGMVVAWDDEDNMTGRQTPATSAGGTATVSGLSFAPGLVIGYSISDEPAGQGTGAKGAVGFSVITPDFQWTALVDDAASGYGTDVGAFQSFQRGICDRVQNSDVHAGTVALTTDGFVTTTQQDAITPSEWIWHAFGHPKRAVWIPHIYRLVRFRGGVRGPQAVPVTGDILLEDGDRIELEDGSGVLLL